MKRKLQFFASALTVLVVGIGLGYLWFAGTTGTPSASADQAISAPIVPTSLSSSVMGPLLLDLRSSLLTAVDKTLSDGGVYSTCQVDHSSFNDAFANTLKQQNSITLFTENCAKSKILSGDITVNLFSASGDFIHDLTAGTVNFSGKLDQTVLDDTGTLIQSTPVNTSFSYQRERDTMSATDTLPSGVTNRCSNLKFSVSVGYSNPKFNSTLCQK